MNITKYLGQALNRAMIFINSRKRSSVSIELKVASFLFARKLADYYLFLADVIESTQGKKHLLDVFKTDAERYAKTSRGKLSSHWAKEFGEGGRFARTFAGTLPDEDVAMISTLQSTGDENALQNGLRDLAKNRALVAKARSMILITMAAALLGAVVVIVSIMILPYFIVPQLVDNFSMLPRERFPGVAISLIGFSDFVESYWTELFLGFIALLGICKWSLTSTTGKMRLLLDKYGIAWGVYRDFQSMRFLSNLASMVKKGSAAKGLRESIELQLHGASRWKQYHITKMLALIDIGNVGPDIFCTGMLSKEMQFTMTDLIDSRGMEGALSFVKERLEDRALAKLSVQANILSAVLMVICLLVSTYLMTWQLAAMDALIESLKMYITN